MTNITILIEEVKKMKVNNNILFRVTIFFILVTLVGCTRVANNYGQKISNFDVVPIKDILINTGDYAGKTITVKGKIISECPSGCWFNLGQDAAVIYVDLNPSGFAIPQITGKTVLVQGRVDIKDTKPIFIGQGIEIQ